MATVNYTVKKGDTLATLPAPTKTVMALNPGLPKLSTGQTIKLPAPPPTPAQYLGNGVYLPSPIPGIANTPTYQLVTQLNTPVAPTPQPIPNSVNNGTNGTYVGNGVYIPNSSPTPSVPSVNVYAPNGNKGGTGGGGGYGNNNGGGGSVVPPVAQTNYGNAVDVSLNWRLG